MKPHAYAKPNHKRAQGRGLFSLIFRALLGLIRLIFPVLTLLAIAFAADLSSDLPVHWLDHTFASLPEHLWPSKWLAAGHLVFPLSFFALNLVNRRYGVTYASASLVMTWAILAGLTTWFATSLGVSLLEMVDLSARTMLSFVGAAFISQLTNVAVYEITRGFPWWRAPFYASIAASLVFCLIFYPCALLGLNPDWNTYMFVYALILSGISFLGLFPYFALKSIFSPIKGSGYAPD